MAPTALLAPKSVEVYFNSFLNESQVDYQECQNKVDTEDAEVFNFLSGSWDFVKAMNKLHDICYHTQKNESGKDTSKNKKRKSNNGHLVKSSKNKKDDYFPNDNFPFSD